MLWIAAPAKINLSLDIKHRRPDGYHEVDMIMQSIALSDYLSIAASDQEILTCSNPRLPVDERNIVWRAVKLLQRECGIQRGFAIHLIKNIPIAAGLAGGSSDAAAVLLGLNHFWNLRLSLQELQALGLKLGADIPFCMQKGTCRAEGIGEKLTRVTSRLLKPLLLITPPDAVITASVYQNFQLSEIKKHPNIPEALLALENGNLEKLTESWGNVLEKAARGLCPRLDQLFELLGQHAREPFLMSGSGPTMFIMAPQDEQLHPLLREIPTDWFTCLTEMTQSG